MRNKNYKPPKIFDPLTVQGGMTLIEMMLAMAISSVLLLGSFTIYTQTRSSYRTTESVAHLQENVRFAIDTLAHDVQLSQFWGRNNQAGQFTYNTAQVQIFCDGIDVTDWALDSDPGSDIAGVPAVDATDDTYDFDCPGVDPRDESDAILIRHANVEANAEAIDGHVQIHSNGGNGKIFASDQVPGGTVGGDIYDVIVNAYYVSNQSKYDATLPALRRRSLVGDTMQDQEIIPGVENMQVQFGIAIGDEDQVSGYVDSDRLPDDEEYQIRSVRLWLLVRSEMTEKGQGFSDTKSYSPPDADLADITPASDANYPAEYRRASITKTIYLRNM